MTMADLTELKSLIAEYIERNIDIVANNEMYTLLREEYPEDDEIDLLDIDDYYEVKYSVNDGHISVDISTSDTLPEAFSETFFDNIKKRALSLIDNFVNEAISINEDKLDEYVTEYVKNELTKSLE